MLAFFDTLAYNAGMTNDEISEAIKKKGLSVRCFARMLGVGYCTLRLALKGQRPMSLALRRHSSLLLSTLPDSPPVKQD